MHVRTKAYPPGTHGGSPAHFRDLGPPKSEIMKSLSRKQRLELIGVDISVNREKTVRLPPVLRATRSQRLALVTPTISGELRTYYGARHRT